MYDEKQAREYLAKVLAWPEGDRQGYVNIHWTTAVPDRPRPVWSGRACRTLDQAINAIKWANTLPNTRDFYVCQSLQREAEERTSKKGNKYLSAVRSQNNAVALRSIFLDVDFKGGEFGYDTQELAIAGLANLMNEVDLPKPSMVTLTGNGMHVYWTLALALDRISWERLAFGLAEAARKHGFKCDSQCTIDAARVLRVPGTLNRKDPANPKPAMIALRGELYSLERLVRGLGPYLDLNASPRASLPQQTPIQGVSDLEAGVDMPESHQPIDIASLIPECGFVRHALQTGGASYSNPLWNLTTLISTFVDDGYSVAHLMARKHPEYTKESTDELFARKVRERDEKGIGWPACRVIAASGAAQCSTCPHLKEAKSPLNFGRRTPLPSPVQAQIATLGVTTNDLPDGYTRDKNGVIYKRVQADDGSTDQLPVCQFPMFAPWVQRDPWALNFTTVTDRVQQITLPTADVGGREMRKALQAQGMMLRDRETRLVTEFIVSWITKLRQTKDAVVSSAPFGWVEDNNRNLEGFAYAGHVWSKGEPRMSSAPDAVLLRRYKPAGDVGPWHDAVAMLLEQERPALEAILASSFAAPLVRFTNARGLLMSAYSPESGIGKSSTIQTAAAVWGDPVTTVQGLSDTTNQTTNAMGHTRSLPMYWDELKNENDSKRFVDIAFSLTRGRDKGRLNASVQQREIGTWQTLLVAGNNDSLLDYIVAGTKMTTAGLYRIFEFTVPKGEKGILPLEEAMHIVGKLEYNYGHIGLEYAKFLGANHDRIAQEVKQFHGEINMEVNANQDERYWTALVAVIVMGIRYAAECGFCQMDEANVRAFMLEQLSKMRDERARTHVDMGNDVNISNVLGRFLNEMSGQHMLVTNRVWVGAGKPPKGVIFEVRDGSRLNGVYVRVGVEDKILRIVSSVFSDWLAKNGYSRVTMTRAMEREFKMQTVKGRIGSGTERAGPTEYLLQIDLAGTPHLNFIDEA